MREDEVHWSDHELLGRLYGVDPGSDAVAAELHLKNCAACGARWRTLMARRNEILDEAARERAVRFDQSGFWARLDRRHQEWGSPWLHAASTAALLLVATLLLTPAWQNDVQERTAPPRATANDTELFRELATLSEPEYLSAAEPVRALFDEAAKSSEREEED